MKTDEDFIERVKDFDLLYNKKNFNYSNVSERDRIWMTLSREFNCDAKKRWIRLRDKYVRSKRMLKYDGSDFQSSMSFIDKHIKPRRRFPKNEIYCDEPEIEDVKSFYNEFCTEITSEIQNSTDNMQVQDTSDFSDNEATQSKIEQVSPYDETFQLDFIKTLKAIQDKLQKKMRKSEENDEDTCFMRLITSKMNKMSSVEKSLFQLEILKKADEIIINKN
ncbi:uncharacterized protein LOC129615545 [Condylostylus longicornis]|uniref:uncharacterized protein LOC129615545 n=1 Tax=Condylostylus longicornis TaxID=2530218 RepID=UPI00244DB51B|nr:uncharacterized protein LOC129615545 [Condylostylus longicornis]